MEKEHPFFVELTSNLGAIWTAIETLAKNDTLPPNEVAGAKQSASNAIQNVLDATEKLEVAEPAAMKSPMIELTPEMEVSAHEPMSERESTEEQPAESQWQGGRSKKKKW